MFLNVCFVLPFSACSLYKLCNALGEVGNVFKCLFCIAFFSLLRQSNLLVSKGVQDNWHMVLRRWGCTLVCGFCYVAPKPFMPGSATASSQFLQFLIARSVQSQLQSDMLRVLPPAPPRAPLFLPRVRNGAFVRVTGYISFEVPSLGFYVSCFTLHSSRKGAPLWPLLRGGFGHD